MFEVFQCYNAVTLFAQALDNSVNNSCISIVDSG